ncbi:MAG: histidinol dehydrogenase [Nanoarchaeota archaeon]|nr:histidinol dehydrogenase [Nanoarchaeota archaeon]
MIEVRMIDYGTQKEFIDRIRNRSSSADVESCVQDIIDSVKKGGDAALLELTLKFDKVQLEPGKILVSDKEIKEAYSKITEKQKKAIKAAIANVEKFAQAQKPKGFTTEISNGVKCGVILRPLEKVGCYIPAGRYPLPSTTYMTIVPARIAGVKEIVVTTPPKKDGKADPGIIVAADMAGACRIFKIGGAQAIAALAFGTETIPKVDKICGPGNIYVTVAKKLLYGTVGIDMLAGPSEIVIIASEKAEPGFVAADMLAQAEHDPLAASILITDSKKLAEEVKEELSIQAEKLSSKETIRQSFDNYSCIIIAKDKTQAVELSNTIAPEHLEIIGYEKGILKDITNAGSVFFGSYSCEAAGDYCSGTNHVLPTGESARVRSGLSVYDFLKMITIQYLTKPGLEGLKETIGTLADMEGLPAHKNACMKRFEGESK